MKMGESIIVVILVLIAFTIGGYTYGSSHVSIYQVESNAELRAYLKLEETISDCMGKMWPIEEASKNIALGEFAGNNLKSEKCDILIGQGVKSNGSSYFINLENKFCADMKERKIVDCPK